MSFRKQRNAALFFAFLVCLSGIVLTAFSVRSRQKAIQADSDKLVQAIGLGLESSLDNFDYMARIIAQNPKVYTLCQNPD
ncbi:MAG: hypothetical protein JW874_10895, partial [Spirochaetales bacterium]|nr:hypothetical protein [Spirochaetales bacterium]